jgi:hypothetical protein
MNNLIARARHLNVSKLKQVFHLFNMKKAIFFINEN